MITLAAALAALPAKAGPCDAPSLSEGPDDLDQMFDAHRYAFLARVEAVLRPGVLADPEIRETTELFIFQPPLKGAVPNTLSFELANRCMPDFSEGAVYLIFSNDLAEAPAPADVRAVLAYESGPYIEWIARWVEDKHRNEPLLQALSDLQWQHRLLVIAGADATADTLSQLQDRQDETDDRDLLWWIAMEDDLYSNYPGRIAPELKQQLLSEGRSKEASVILIGKDGSVKLDLRYFDLDRILSRIDSMPMRAQEMRD